MRPAIGSRQLGTALAIVAALLATACQPAGQATSPPPTAAPPAATTPAASSASATSSAQGSPAAGACTPASPAVPISFRLDWVPLGIHSPFFLALERGLYRDAGLDVKIEDGRGSGVTAQAVGSGTDQFGFVAASAIAGAVSNGVPIRSVAMITNKNTYGALVDEASPIRELKDLLGKKLLVVAGQPDQYWTLATLELNGLDSNGVEFQAVEPASKMGSYTQGVGDAVVAPAPTNLLAVAEARPSRAILYADYGLAALDFGLITTEQMITEREAQVRCFVEATIRGWQDALDDPKAAVDAHVKNRPDAEAGLLQAQLESVRPYLVSAAGGGDPIGCPAETDWKATVDLLNQYAELGAEETPLDRFYTNEYVPGC